MNTSALPFRGDKIVACFYAAPRTDMLRFAVDSIWTLAEPVMETLGCRITHITCGCRVEVGGIKNYRQYSFREMASKIREQNKSGNLTHVELSCMPASSKAYVAFDWSAYVAITGPDRKIGLTVCQFGVDAGVLATTKFGNSSDGLLGICSKLRSTIRGEYGFATRMPCEFLPRGYSTGLAGRMPRSLVLETNSWRQDVWEQFASRLRNVHGMNFVGLAHLEQPVGAQSLRDWIRTGSGRGSVSGWECGLSLWSFADCGQWPDFLRWDDPSVCTTREELERQKYFPWQAIAQKRVSRQNGKKM